MTYLELYEETLRFNCRLENVPDEWRGPIVEVIDTLDTIKLGLASIGIDDNFLLMEATRLALERHDKVSDAASDSQSDRGGQ